MIDPQPLTPGQQAILDAIPLREPSQFDLFSSTTSATQPTTLDCLIALANQPEHPPRPPTLLVHPAHAEHEEMRECLRGMQRAGVDVRVMARVGGPAVPLNDWRASEVCGNCATALPGGCGGLFRDEKECRWKPTPEPAPVRHSTFAELNAQAQRLVAEARQEGKGLPNFVVTVPELNELLRANGWQELRPGATFHGMTIRVLRG